MAREGLALPLIIRKESNEGNHISGGLWYAVIPPDHSYVKTATACIRQANDLLSPFNTDASWH